MALKPPDTARSRAVLIGAGEYQDPGIPNVGTAKTSVAELADALCGDYGLFDKGCCFQVNDPATASKLHRPIREAAEAAEDVLLVYYVGHAVRIKGGLHLLPCGTERDEEETGSLGFRKIAETLRTTRAAHVVVILDCCHSGTAADELGPGDAVEDAETIEAVRTEIEASVLGGAPNSAGSGSVRNVYLLASCGPHQRAAADDGGGRTAFTGMLINVLTNGIAGVGGTLLSPDDVLAEVARRLPETTTSQSPNRLSRGGTTETLALARNADVLRRREALGHDWQDQAAELGDVWNCVREKPEAVDGFQRVTAALVGALSASAATATASVRADPWHNPLFLPRMLQYVRELLKEKPDQPSGAGNVRLELSAEEAALLVVMPFLYCTWRYRAVEALCAARPDDLSGSGGPALPARLDYEKYLRFWPRHVERAVASGECPAIGWWLFHGWLDEHRFTRQGATLEGVCGRFPATVAEEAERLPPLLRSRVSEAFDWGRVLCHLMDALYTAPAVPGEKPGGREDTAGAQPGKVRLGLLAVLLTTARMMAVEPVRLPDILVEQLGSVRKMDLKDLRELAPTWNLQHRSWLLTTGSCHAAVGEALRRHVAELDQFAAEVDRGTSAIASALPWRFQVRPDPGRASDSIRFSLSGPRVQELLMGSQLYGSPLLAVREMFQNASDANKQRANRGEFLERTSHGGFKDGWTGKIELTFGDEGGRTYLECRDTGVGMGLDELQRLFARGGSRREDIREFVDEQADWERAELTPRMPNSQFGIGVFSYFMIGDSIQVRTCLFGRDGRPGGSFRVDIDNPASLFRIETSPSPFWGDSQTGTSVRLYLRPDIEPQAVMELLQETVWVCEWDMDLRDTRTTSAADDQRRTLSWSAGELAVWSAESRPHAVERRPGEVRRSTPQRKAPLAIRPHQPVAHRAGSQVWWIGGTGGVLCDGVWIGMAMFGAVVNLTGPDMPRLTVNRSEPLHPELIDVGRPLRAEIPVLFEPGARVLSLRWLDRLAARKMAVALEIADAALVRKHRWSILDTGLGAETAFVGCFPGEGARLEQAARRAWPQQGRKVPGDVKLLAAPSPAAVVRALTGGLPHYLARLRFLAWVRTEAFPGVRCADTVQCVPIASPADLMLLNEFRFGGARDWRVWPLRTLEPASAGHVAEVALRTGITARRVRERLAEYGCSWTSAAGRLRDPSKRDLVLLSRDHDSVAPWLPTDAVDVEDVLESAIKLRCPADEVVERYLELGIEVPECLLPGGAGLAEAESRGYVRIRNFLAAARAEDGSRRVDPARSLSIRQVLSTVAASRLEPCDLLAVFGRLGFTIEPSVVSYLSEHQGLPLDDYYLLSQVIEAADISERDLLEGLPIRFLVYRLLSVPSIVRRGLRESLRRLGGFMTIEAIGLPSADSTEDDKLSDQHFSLWIAVKTRFLDAASAESVELWQVAVLAASQDLDPAEVVRVLAEIGVRVPVGAAELEMDVIDARLISDDLDGRGPWLNSRRVPIHHLYDAEQQRLPNLYRRLIRLGFELPQRVPRRQLSRFELTLASQDLDGEGPWLDPDQLVTVGRVSTAAAQFSRSIVEIVKVFVKMGFETPPELAAGKLADADEALLGAVAEQFPAGRLNASIAFMDDIVGTARRTGLRLADVATRLRALGFKVAADCVDELLNLSISEVGRFRYVVGAQREQAREYVVDDEEAGGGSGFDGDFGMEVEVTDDFTADLDEGLDATVIWFSHADVIPAWHVLIAAEEAAMSPASMRRYFLDQGFTVSEDVSFDDEVLSP